MEKKTKRIIIGATAVTALAGASYIGIAELIFNKVFKQRSVQNEPNLNAMILNWYSEVNVENVWIKSFDGLNLHGKRIINNPCSDNWIILVHGYRNNHTSMIKHAYEFSKHGYNCLLIDQRACGESDGEYTTLGWYEQFDLIKWIDDLVNDYPDSNICLFGFSMGATSVMMSTGSILPKNVKCAISNSGFNNLVTEMAYLLKKDYKINMNLFMPYLKLKIAKVLHFDMLQHNTDYALNHSEVPLLFVHGSHDEVVPYDHVFDNYYGASCVKELYTIEGATHFTIFDSPEYYDRLYRFMNRFM